MKTKLFWLMAILSVISISCDKTSLGGNDGPLPELPPLEEVDDVCTKMDDLKFMAYCYENIDVNKDGKVSMVEASATESIECNATSFAGIEYFTNLKNFESHSVETVDLRYNSMLETINLSYSRSIEKIDLRYNKNISILQFNAFIECEALTWVALPSSIRSIGEQAFLYCPIEEFLLYAIDVPSFYYDTFTNTGGAVLKVPAESVEAYKNSAWAEYFGTIEAL